KKLGFKGVVISDDLCMGAVTGSMPVQLAAVRAMEAGHDLLIIAHDKAAMGESAELLEGAVADGLIERGDIEDSARRVSRLLERKRASAAKPSAKEGARIAAASARAAVSVVREGGVALPMKPDLILFPDFAQVKARFTFEGGANGPLNWLK